MSEYQYYEFQAIDRPLTEREMRELRAVSTRATITSTRFVNVYNWGDLKANPLTWMEKYFDAFLYFANWGTHQLIFRLPRRLLDLDTAELYCRGDSATAWTKGDFVVLAFQSDDKYGDYPEDESGWLSSLLPLRADLASGDHRALYLAWLLCVQNEEVEEEETEPPVPPGLARLTAALQAFAEFLRIEDDLIAAAAERSPAAPDEPSREAFARWIAALPEAEKNQLLVQLVAGGGGHIQPELLRRFRQAYRTPATPAGQPHTVAELLAAAERRAEERRRRDAARAAREQARREREEAAARERRLDELAPREAEAWREVDTLIAARQAPAYDEAVRLLADLRQLGLRESRAAEVEERIRALRAEHARKTTFLQRLRKAGLA